MTDKILFNETLNSCFIALNGSYFDDDDQCTNFSTNKPDLFSLCMECIVKKQNNTLMTKTQQFLSCNSSWILLIPAISFNLLSFLVLLSFSKDDRKNKITVNFKNSMNFYLKCLCISDILAIFTKTLHEFIVIRNQSPDRKEMNKKFELSLLDCKIMHCMNSVFTITSIYLLILMSIDRLIVVVFPFKVISAMRPKRAKILSSILLLISVAYSLCFNVILIEFKDGYIRNGTNATVYSCEVKNKSTVIGVEIDHLVCIFMPIIILCACNLLIHIALYKQRNNMILINAQPKSEIKNKADISNNADSNKKLLNSSNKAIRKERTKKQTRNKKHDNLHNNSPAYKNSTNISGIFKLFITYGLKLNLFYLF